MLEFKKGSYDLNDNPNFNFQLNRVIMWDGGTLEDIEKISGKIIDSASWKKELITLGNKAMEEKRTKEAIAYYRMSEFFMYDGDPDKKKYYKLATDMFYEYYTDYFDSGTVSRFEVSYESIKLPVMYAKAKGKKKDTILLHGGNDSYFEEFFFTMLYFAEKGFDVYLFEGPGQGGVIRIQDKHFTYKWEKPVKAILDFFNLNDITIVGASLGGMLAPRAAAFDKRIQRVIAWSIFPNFFDVILFGLSKNQQCIIKWCIKYKMSFLINTVVNKKLKSGDESVKWGLLHGMYAYQAKTPYEYIVKMNKYQMLDIAHKIEQDMLIIGANKDHFIDYHTVGKEIDALTNVRSLTVRIFTEKENAGEHCNVGNPRLGFDTMINWIEQIKKRDNKI
ncbi:alpha/beta hydrolase [Clostridium tetani]|uniref:alpha/beta hydrolase n=1 Tax=Clostridium tetani TaxID=1513 RepID=UPI0024A88CF7|nr:alpha/beta fold hydrolase [Clostridium tetani]